MTAAVVTITLLVLLVTAAAGASGMRSPARSSKRTTRVDHVHVEVHNPCLVEDRVVDALWRAAISTTNHSRRPRHLPTIAERATVSAGHRVYLAQVYLDDECTELNPGAVSLAWVEFVLPAGMQPGSLTLVHLREMKRPVSHRFRGVARVSAG